MILLVQEEPKSAKRKESKEKIVTKASPGKEETVNGNPGQHHRKQESGKKDQSRRKGE